MWPETTLRYYHLNFRLAFDIVQRVALLDPTLTAYSNVIWVDDFPPGQGIFFESMQYKQMEFIW